MKQALVLALVGAALGGPVFADDQPAPSPAPAAPAPTCAVVRSIDNWQAIDAESAYIYTAPRTRFKVTFFAPCLELKWAVFARVDTRPGGHMCLSPGDALIFGRESPFSRGQLGLEERCVIRTIEPVPYGAPADAPKTP